MSLSRIGKLPVVIPAGEN